LLTFNFHFKFKLPGAMLTVTDIASLPAVLSFEIWTNENLCKSTVQSCLFIVSHNIFVLSDQILENKNLWDSLQFWESWRFKKVWKIPWIYY